MPTVSSTRHGPARMSGFLLGATGMFANMYATQAILPQIGREFGVTPAHAGLTISVVVLMLAAGAWVWGPISDRVGRSRSIVSASALLVAPTLAAAFAPSFGVLLLCRALQGLCMPGLLTVGVPYIREAFSESSGGRAMGAYVSSLVAGGLLGRVGVGLLTSAVGWRPALASLAALPLVGAVVMYRTLPRDGPAMRSRGTFEAVAGQLRNATLLRASAGGGAAFFAFVGLFSFITYRLEEPPFRFGVAENSLLFLLWLCGAIGPVAGRLADRVGWPRVLVPALLLAWAGGAVSLAAALPLIVVALSLVALAMFSAVTAAQIGVAHATDVDRGVASAVYFSVYYGAGALGGYLPGLAWQAWEWTGVVTVALSVLALGITAQLAGLLRPKATGP